jgi:hypothetical protein
MVPAGRLLATLRLPFTAIIPLSAPPVVAVSPTASPPEAWTAPSTLTAWLLLLRFACGSGGLGFGGFYRISGWFLCIHLYLPANFCLSRPKINGNKRILC